MNQFSFFFKDSKPFVKLMMLIFIFMVLTTITGFITIFIPMSSLLSQAISQIIMFGLSVMIWGLMFEDSVYTFLSLEKKNLSYYFIIAVLMLIIATPFIDGVGLWNNNWHFEGEELFRKMEETSEKIMEGFMSDTSALGLIINVLVVAALPAVLEELFFRGAMQPTIINLVKNRFIGILITAIIFSLIHFQPFSSLPRVFLGLFLGYLYVFSKNILVPILFHFLNNLTVVINCYLINTHKTNINLNELGSVFNPYIFVLSILIIASLFVYEIKKEKKIIKDN